MTNNNEILYEYYIPEYVLFQLYYLYLTHKVISLGKVFSEVIILLHELEITMCIDGEEKQFIEIDDIFCNINIADIESFKFSIMEPNKLSAFFNKYFVSFQNGKLMKGIYEVGIFKDYQDYKDSFGAVNDYKDYSFHYITTNIFDIEIYSCYAVYSLEHNYKIFKDFLSHNFSKYDSFRFSIIDIMVSLLSTLEKKEMSKLLPTHLLLYLHYKEIVELKFGDKPDFTKYMFYEFKIDKDSVKFMDKLNFKSNHSEEVNVIADSVPKVSNWSELTIKIDNSDNDRILITINDTNAYFSYVDLGFRDKKSGNPIKCWEILRGIKLYNETITRVVNRTDYELSSNELVERRNNIRKEAEKYKKQISTLREKLKIAFKCELDPIIYDNNSGAYQTQFYIKS